MRLSIAHKSSLFSAGGDGISRHEPLTVANEILRLEITVQHQHVVTEFGELADTPYAVSDAIHSRTRLLLSAWQCSALFDQLPQPKR
jgi:hypothetical protein